jgi:UDP-N-acetylglucosamine 4-epimerase
MQNTISNKIILVTGGAGFIGSNLVDHLLELNNRVICLDNFSTGKRENLVKAHQNPNFTLIEGDIRNYDDCLKAVKGCDFVLHEAALGSVPRSIADPMTTTDVNIGGFVKMLHAAKEEKVKRFIYAASSSTYGDHPDLPKVEHKIGNALSPYAITKYVDELFAKNFNQIYGIDTIGLRYFNVFGRRQDPNGAYAAVIPLWVKSFINHQSPIINGDGEFSRDFTYIDNVVQMNLLAMLTEKPGTMNEVYNTAFGDRTTLNQLIGYLKEFLSEYDPEIINVEIIHGPSRAGDIPHSLASIEKAKLLLNYNPEYNLRDGLYEAVKWYWCNIK